LPHACTIRKTVNNVLPSPPNAAIIPDKEGVPAVEREISGERIAEAIIGPESKGDIRVGRAGWLGKPSIRNAKPFALFEIHSGNNRALQVFGASFSGDYEASTIKQIIDQSRVGFC
jgi:hypothetical protein